MFVNLSEFHLVYFFHLANKKIVISNKFSYKTMCNTIITNTF